MGEILLNIELDYEPSQKEMFVIVKSADDLASKLEANGILIESVEICLNTPKHYHVIKSEQSASFEDDDDHCFEEDCEELIDATTCWEEDDDL